MQARDRREPARKWGETAPPRRNGEEAMQEATAAAPEGWRPWRRAGPFVEHNGPLFYRRLGEDSFAYGFRALPHHGNFNGVVHGGWLFTFADQVVGRVIYGRTGRLNATVSMQAEFAAPVAVGDWVEGTAEPVRLGRNLAFLRATLAVDGAPVLVASGVWKLLAKWPAETG